MIEEPSKRQPAIAKWDATNEAANLLIKARDTARDAKTSRLRQLRLAKELSDAADAIRAGKAKRSKKLVI
jgi:hypothetical protein